VDEEERWRVGWRRGCLEAAAKGKLLGGYEAVCTSASLPASTLSPVRTRPSTPPAVLFGSVLHSRNFFT